MEHRNSGIGKSVEMRRMQECGVCRNAAWVRCMLDYVRIPAEITFPALRVFKSTDYGAHSPVLFNEPGRKQKESQVNVSGDM